MLFNSVEFFIFFLAVLILYFLSPYKYRWIILLAGSYFFYMSWEPAYILLIFLSTVVDYFIAHQMVATENAVKKKRLLGFSLAVNLGMLFIFKYYNFFNENIADILALFNVSYQPTISTLLLPVGISFYTFQTLSYSIDVYRGELVPTKHFGKFALFVSFFPQLVAGPIERASNLLPQLNTNELKATYNNVVAGGSQFIYGLFKKVVVADTIALYVNLIYGDHEFNTGFPLILATVLFAVQIYADFSGYSDMAIGTARIMGYKLTDNFAVPYFSKSTTEFWRRWHISLGSWANDYLFRPIAPNWVRKYDKKGVFISLLITFTIIGLWHGARWTYILFGVIQGVVLGTEFLTRKKRKKLRKKIGASFQNFLGWGITMVIWLISMAIFRSENMGQAKYILSEAVFSDNFWNLRIIDRSVFVNIIVGCFVLFFFDFFVFRKINFHGLVRTKSVYWMIAFIAFFVLMIILFGVSQGSQFIYFQF